MTGVEPVSDLSDSQVVALGGGKTLRAEAIVPTTAVERKNATKRSSARLRMALVDSKLVVPLLVAVAIQRQDCVFGDEEAPLKYLGNLFDQCQQVLFQYIDFLSSHLGIEQYTAILSDVQDLWEKYGIDAGIAFHIARPVLQLAVQKQDAAAKIALQENMERMKEEIKAARAAKLNKSASSATPDPVPSSAETPLQNATTTGPLDVVANGMNGTDDVKMEDVEFKLNVDVPAELLASASPAAQTEIPKASNGEMKKSPWHAALLPSIQVVQQKLPSSITDYLR